MRFERVQAYPDAILPTRGTERAGGYDLYAAEDTVIPGYQEIINELKNAYQISLRDKREGYGIDWEQNILPQILKNCSFDCRPTLVPTGIKIYLDKDKTFDIQARSSLPRKNWLIVANAPGLIDADYVDNPDNEGHIFVQLINLAPFPFTIKKGEKFAQGVIRQYFIVDNDTHGGERKGGFGSTDNINIFTKEEFMPNLFNHETDANIIQNDIVMNTRPDWETGVL